MKCPHCNSEMIEGMFRNQGEKWHNHAFGSFGLPMEFEPEDAANATEPENLWVGDRDGAAGHRCQACGTVVFTPLPEDQQLEEWVCPACGVVVPGRFHHCWKCQCPKPEA